MKALTITFVSLDRTFWSFAMDEWFRMSWVPAVVILVI
jgi:hypothetical protein